MTVQYSHEVLTAGPIGFLKLLIRWRGSIFKLISTDFFVFSILYSVISVMHRFLLSEDYKRQFETVVTYVAKSQSLIPVAFIVGFYVNLIFNRFWKHFNTLPWITKLALMVSSFIHDPNFDANMPEEKKMKKREKTVIIKRAIIRYLTASLLMTLSRVSVPVRKRFLNLKELSNKGLLLEHEEETISKTKPFFLQPFLPVMWTCSIIIRASDKGRISNESMVIGMIDEINKFRQLLQELFLLDQICVPLVYTQVVTLAVYSYFLSCLIGRQFILDPKLTDITQDIVVPIFTILQFIIYIGWIKLALQLVNPIGEDDEDFDLNSFIDYGFQNGMSCVETIQKKQPDLEKDRYFDTKIYKLPKDGEFEYYQSRQFRGSFCEMKIENENWITSIRSLLTLSSGDREQADDGLVKSLNSIPKPHHSARVRSHKSTINSTYDFFASLISSTNENGTSDKSHKEPESDNQGTKSANVPLLIIKEE